MGARVSRSDFTYSYSDEPHATRRKIILQKYPQIKKLMTIDEAFKWQVAALLLAQILSFFVIKDISNSWLLFILAYFIGGVANHAIMLAIHEISHGMAFGTSRPLANKIFAIVANFPLGIPMSISFKKYHIEHHRYQGDELLDTDVPTFMEASFFTSPLRKTIWCILQPFFYTLRPLFVNPKPLEKFEFFNIIAQLAFDLLVLKILGLKILIYMIGGTILAMGLHPVAGHFISEHTLMFENSARANSEEEQPTSSDGNNNKSSQDATTHRQGSGSNDSIVATVDDNGKFLIPETCSYYGPLNWLTFNVGYHVEHHDFPSIPGSKLHLLNKIAPEFYLNLNYHTSWINVLWRYITDPKVSPCARVRRPHLSHRYKMQQLSSE